MTEDFEIIVKWFIAITGLISVMVKVGDSFSEVRRKRNLKSDLDLLDKIDTGCLDSEDREKIGHQTKEILDEYLSIKDTTVKWYDVFYALVLFLGFGWWTIFLYETNTEFTPWTILTGLITIPAPLTP